MKRTINTPVGPINVDTVGEGSAVLLWHSLFVDGRSWNRVRKALSERRQLIVVDGPGHGASAGPDRCFTLDDCAAAASDVLDTLGIERVDWVGNAWGGHVGYVFAASRPERVRSLTAMAAPLVPLSSAERRKIRPLVDLYPFLGPRPVRGIVLDALLSPEARRADPEAVALVSDSLVRPGRRRLQRAMRSVMLGRADLTATAAKVTCPTLVIVGKDDPMWTEEQARLHHPIDRDVRVISLDGVRHLPPLEAPDRVADALTRFWTDCAPTT